MVRVRGSGAPNGHVDGAMQRVWEACNGLWARWAGEAKGL